MDPELRDRWLAHAEQQTAANGRRSGAARTAVVELLAREGQCLLTAQQLTDLLRASETGIGSAASVYRILDDLHQLGLLHRFDGGDGVARYEISDPAHHHHHLVDEASGRVEPFTDDELERAIVAAAQRLGVQLTSHDVILRGRRTPPRS
ncbi:MAG: Fur family transcriptional regulator [Patulibacter sp.]